MADKASKTHHSANSTNEDCLLFSGADSICWSVCPSLSDSSTVTGSVLIKLFVRWCLKYEAYTYAALSPGFLLDVR